jgi:hypothetical protein
VLALLLCAKFCDTLLFSATLGRALFILSLFLLLFRDILEELLVEIFAGSLELADRLWGELGPVNRVVSISPLVGK